MVTLAIRAWLQERKIALGPILLIAGIALAAWLSQVYVAYLIGEQALTQAALTQRIAGLPQAAQVSPSPGYYLMLPKVVSVHGVMQTFQRSALERGTSLVNVSSTSVAGDNQTLGRSEITLTLHGSYTSIKATVSEALSRYPKAVVQSWQLRRLGSSAIELEATLAVIFPLRPTTILRTPETDMPL